MRKLCHRKENLGEYLEEPPLCAALLDGIYFRMGLCATGTEGLLAGRVRMETCFDELLVVLSG